VLFRSPTKGATGEQLEAIKAARRQLVGIYGMSALFAGAKGLPLYWIAELAYNMFQDEDEDDFDTVMRGFLGDFFYKGPVNYFTNLSIADRVGWTDLIWREQKGDSSGASAVAQFIETLGGAPVSIINSVLRGKDLIAEGQWERGIEAILPVSMRNILKGGRYAIEGANTLRGDAVGDVNGYNAAMQVLGFAPADLMKQYEENAYMTEKAKAIRSIEKNALKKYYAAMREGDVDGMSTFVLVHGAWGGAHGFRHLRRGLQAAGHEVFTPSLTGIGERVHLAAGPGAAEARRHVALEDGVARRAPLVQEIAQVAATPARMPRRDRDRVGPGLLEVLLRREDARHRFVAPRR
jgi:hypothetical protein